VVQGGSFGDEPRVKSVQLLSDLCLPPIPILGSQVGLSFPMKWPGKAKDKLKAKGKELRNFLRPNHPSTPSNYNPITQDPDQLKESPESSERLSSPPKRTFVQTANPQYDIAVLHIAFILKNSRDLRELIVAVEQLSSKPSVR